MSHATPTAASVNARPFGHGVYPAPAAEPAPCFADQLADAVYGRQRAQRDRSAKVRGYTAADARWWAAECDGRDKAEEAGYAAADAYDWRLDPEGRFEQMDEAEAMAEAGRYMEAGLNCW